MNLKAFVVDALGNALELGLASPDDVLRHVTPDVLAEYLPRPLWARLLTACLGASRVDAQLVVETIGVPNLCEHVPTALIWACISEVALRSIGREFVPAAISTSRAAPLAMTPPPAPEQRAPAPAPAPRPRGPSIPPPIAGSTPPAGIVATTGAPAPAESLADVVAALEAEERPASPPSRTRTPTSQRFRGSNPGIGRLAANNTRRPQAPITPVEPARPQFRRGSTEVTDYEIETEVGKEEATDWKSSLAVEDEQLVDWSATSDETAHGGPDDYGRKR